MYFLGKKVGQFEIVGFSKYVYLRSICFQHTKCKPPTGIQIGCNKLASCIMHKIVFRKFRGSVGYFRNCIKKLAYSQYPGSKIVAFLNVT